VKDEQIRFNALSQERAKEILAKADGQPPDMRSCWYCNKAHEHLKNREVMMCFACGIFYLQGFPSFFVVKRSKGEIITDEDIETFSAALQEADK
jgi:hypothetical protein